MSLDWITRYEGTCPKCHEHKFIGHGPLCIECYLAPTNHK